MSWSWFEWLRKGNDGGFSWRESLVIYDDSYNKNRTGACHLRIHQTVGAQAYFMKMDIQQSVGSYILDAYNIIKKDM